METGEQVTGTRGKGFTTGQEGAAGDPFVRIVQMFPDIQLLTLSSVQRIFENLVNILSFHLQ